MPSTPLVARFNTWRAALGIRARLLLLMMTLVVPFLVYLGASLTSTFALEGTHARREVLDRAQLTAARLDDRLSSIRLLLSTLSQSMAPAWGNPGRVDALLRSLTPELAGQGVDLSIWSPDGRSIAFLHAEPGPGVRSADMAKRAFFQEVLRTGRFAHEAPVSLHTGGAPVALLGAPALQDGRPVGVIVVALRLEGLSDFLDPKGSLPKGGVITVVDIQGTVVSRSLNASAWVGKQMLKTPQERAPLGQEDPGVAELVGFDGVSRIFGYASLKMLPWTVFVGVPAAVAMAPLKARLIQSTAFGAAMLAIGVVLAFWAAQRVTRPLRQLDQHAARLGQGDLAYRSPARGTPEIHRLASTLNSTAQALQERTQAVEDARRLLRTVTDFLPALVSLLDRSERFLFANLAYQEWLGLDPAALVGKTLQEVYGAPVYQTLLLHLQAAWAGQRTVYERPMATLQGDRWGQVTLVPRRGPDGWVTELCVMILDVTERRVAQENLARSEERLSLAVEGSGLALFDWDIRAQRIYHSAQSAVLRGGAPQESTWSLAALRELVHPDDVEPLVAAQKAAILNPQNNSFSAEFRVRTVSGGWVWLRSRGRVVERDAQGLALRLAGTDVDISLRKATEERLRQLAEYDPLTGLPNRALFHDRLQQALERAKRHVQPMAVMFLDIDHFKRVNDSYGHETGDELLKTFAARLQAGVRKCDTVARLAGDEFTIILEEIQATGDALTVAQALVESTRRPVVLGADTVQITTSVGVAVWLHGDMDGPELLRQADAALYEAKHQGRDRCHLIEAQPGGLAPVGV